MKTKEEFKEFYTSILASDFSPEYIDNYRKLQKRQYLRWLTIIPIILLCIFFSFFKVIDNGPSFIPIIGIIICVVLILIKPKINIPTNLKTNSIQKISKYINPTLKYADSGFIPYNTLYKSDLFNGKTPYSYIGCDLFSGSINNIKFEFSNISLVYKDESRFSNRSNTHSQEFIFFAAELNKKFWSRTFVFPDYLEWSIGNFSKPFETDSPTFGEIVKLENIEFEKIFKVYSDSQVKARYLLTAGVMEKLVELYNKLGTEVKISFIDSHMYMLLPGHFNLGSILDFDYVNDLLSLDNMYSYYATISTFAEILQELNFDDVIFSYCEN